MKLQDLVNALNAVPKEKLQHLETLIKEATHIFLIGNGGSNAIASHMAVDYTKFMNKKCYVPNSSDLMTMIVNDYGKDVMYSKFIEYHNESDRKQLAVLISSSGNSANIINAAKTCLDLGIPTVLLSGFDTQNPLNSISNESTRLKFWVDSKDYGVVEMAHHSILHSVV